MCKPEQVTQVVKTTESMIKNELKTEVQASYGYHQIGDAIQFYLKNQTAGKILLKPSLTKSESPKL